ncbi:MULTISPECIES: 4'-phosphopantetheinyl transferase family protein [unclassified Spongiibacter]|uniref:4'-phosphopantetheinyl transferase family protein n=1 Tax=unclassified Spongiibacter TaxID=2631504 RepID=UPI00257C134F|nr:MULTISPECIES: 4'-phosphopantetheinyl transferase superfamily protein [unclassified Spongiibacter]
MLDLPGTAQQAVICQFDVNHYRPALFELLDIAMPAKLAGAKDSRCADYLAGRCAARQALAMAGADEVAPLRGASGEVLWPPGLQGAISHHGDHALCVVSREGFPGIDLERVMRPEVCCEVAGLVGHLSERRLLRESGMPEAEAISILFSAKESLYKALFPALRHYVDFLDVGLKRFLPEQQCMELELLRCQHPERCGQRFTVHWQCCDGVVFTYLCASLS